MGIYNYWPYTNVHELNLDWVVMKIKELSEEWATYHTEWDTWKDDTEQAYQSLHDYVMNYFNNLDITEEISSKIEELISDGTFTEIVDPIITQSVTDWLEEHVTPTTPVIDDTLTISGAGADAKVTGDKIRANIQAINSFKEIGMINIATPSNAENLTVNGLTFTVNEDGFVTVEGTATANTQYVYWTQGIEKLEKEKTYYIICEAENVKIRMVKSVNGALSQITSTGVPYFNYPAEADFIELRLYVDNGVTVNETVKPYLIQIDKAYDTSLKPYPMNNLTFTRFYGGGAGEFAPFSADGTGSPYYTAQSDLIPVTVGSVLDFTLEYGSVNQMYIATIYLDENKNFIKRIAEQTADKTKGHVRILNIDEQVKYIAFVFRTFKESTTFKATLLTNMPETNPDYYNQKTIDTAGYTYNDLIIFSYWYINGSGGYTKGNGKQEAFTSKIVAKHGDVFKPHLTYSELPEGSLGMWLCVALYDVNNNFIRREPICNYEAITDFNRPYTINDVNVGFIAFTYRAYSDVITSNFNVEKIGEVAVNKENITNVASELELLKEGYHPYGERSNYLVKSINHRGYNVIAPENTLPAYRLSKQKGFKYVETDISLTSDGIPVLLHDDTINRTARNLDGSVISTTINISSITYAQALNYDFGIWKNQVYAGTKIPTLEEFIALCKELSLMPYIELKGSTITTQAQVDNIIDIIKSYNMLDKSTFISFSSTLLEYVLNSYPKARIGLVGSTLTDGGVNWITAHTTDDNEVFANISINNITTATVTSAKNNNIELEAWTSDTTESAINNMNGYVTGLTCNNYVAGDTLINSNIGNEYGIVL